MGGNSLRPNVLSLYRQILRMGKTWEAISGNSFDTKLERDYIMNEARHLFRKNRYLQDETEIQLRLREAESRLALGEYCRPLLTWFLLITFVKSRLFVFLATVFSIALQDTISSTSQRSTDDICQSRGWKAWHGPGTPN